MPEWPSTANASVMGEIEQRKPFPYFRRVQSVAAFVPCLLLRLRPAGCIPCSADFEVNPEKRTGAALLLKGASIAVVGAIFRNCSRVTRHRMLEIATSPKKKTPPFHIFPASVVFLTSCFPFCSCIVHSGCGPSAAYWCVRALPYIGCQYKRYPMPFIPIDIFSMSGDFFFYTVLTQ